MLTSLCFSSTGTSVRWVCCPEHKTMQENRWTKNPHLDMTQTQTQTQTHTSTHTHKHSLTQSPTHRHKKQRLKRCLASKCSWKKGRKTWTKVAPSSLSWHLIVRYWKYRHEKTSDKKWQYCSRVRAECVCCVFLTYYLESTKGTSAVKKLVGQTSLRKHFSCTSLSPRSGRERKMNAYHSFEGWVGGRGTWSGKRHKWARRGSVGSVDAMRKNKNRNTVDCRRRKAQFWKGSIRPLVCVCLFD